MFTGLELSALAATVKTAADIIDDGPVGPLISFAVSNALPFGAVLDAVDIAHDVFGVGASGSTDSSNASSDSMYTYEPSQYYPVTSPTASSGVSYGGSRTVSFSSNPRVRY